MSLKEKYNQLVTEINQLEQEISRLRPSKQTRENLEMLYDVNKQKLEQLKMDKFQLMKTLEKEENDVQEINESRLLQFMYAIIGGKEEKLKKEEAEALIAEENFRLKCLMVDQVSNELHELNKKIGQAKQNEYYLSENIKKRNELLKDKIELEELLNHPNIAEALDTSELDQKLAKLRSKHDLIEETYQNGLEILIGLDEVRDYLIDSFFQPIVTVGSSDEVVRRRYIKLAEKRLNELPLYAQNYSNQLKILNYNYSYNVEYNISSTLNFLHRISSDLFTDIVILKVAKMRSEVENHLDLVSRYNKILETDKNELQTDINQLEKELYEKLKYIE